MEIRFFLTFNKTLFDCVINYTAKPNKTLTLSRLYPQQSRSLSILFHILVSKITSITERLTKFFTLENSPRKIKTKNEIYNVSKEKVVRWAGAELLVLDICLEDFFGHKVEVLMSKRYGFSSLSVPFPRDP